MKLTDPAIDAIKQHEGLRLEAYPDPASGGDPWTIGYGHTSRAGSPAVVPGMKITKVEAERISQRDLQVFEDGVRRLLQVNLSDQQFSALDAVMAPA